MCVAFVCRAHGWTGSWVGMVADADGELREMERVGDFLQEGLHVVVENGFESRIEAWREVIPYETCWVDGTFERQVYLVAVRP